MAQSDSEKSKDIQYSALTGSEVSEIDRIVNSMLSSSKESLQPDELYSYALRCILERRTLQRYTWPDMLDTLAPDTPI